MHRLSDRGLLSVWRFGNLSRTELMISVLAFRDGAVAWLASCPTDRNPPLALVAPPNQCQAIVLATSRQNYKVRFNMTRLSCLSRPHCSVDPTIYMLHA